MRTAIAIVTSLIPTMLQPTNAFAQGTKPAAGLKENLLLTMMSSLVGALFGAAGSYFAARLKVKELEEAFKLKVEEMATQISLQRRAEQQSQRDSLRLRYVNPLRVAASELRARMAEIDSKMSDPAEEQKMRGWFEYVRKYRKGEIPKPEFVDWWPYVGTFALGTLHMTSTYFAGARDIELRAPFSELDPEFSKGLSAQLSVVKKAFGGEDGVWENLQDAMGEIVSRGETAMSYREFCQKITDLSDEFDYGPFRRLVDFYWFLLNPSRAKAIQSALQGVEEFLFRMSDSSPIPGAARK